MKTGSDLKTLAIEIKRQAESKRDYVAQTTQLVPELDGAEVKLSMGKLGTYGINDLAHTQLAEVIGVPRPYYDRMRREAPALLAETLGTWFDAKPEARLIRTLDGKVRAVLSDRYRPLDNVDFANAVLPILAKRKLEVMSCEITEKRLYIKAVDTQLFKDVPIGHKMGDGSHKLFETCAPAVILSNSEVGFGRLALDTGVYTRACTNMCLFSDGGMKRTHLGSRHAITEGIENIDELLSARTKSKTDEALWLQVQDVLKAVFDPERTKKRLEKIAAATTDKITGKVTEVVELVGKKLSLNETEKDNVLRFLIEGGQLNRYGLHAAVTRSAQEADTYERATEMEYLGGAIIELPKADWSVLAEAA